MLKNYFDNLLDLLMRIIIIKRLVHLYRVSIMHSQQHVQPAIRRFPTIDSTRLFAVGKEIRIVHEGEEYRLRITSNNKLILTK